MERCDVMSATLLEKKNKYEERKNDRKDSHDTPADILREARKIIEERKERNRRAINRPNEKE